MFEYVFSSPDLQPDQIKIYPCVVNEHAELYKWYKQKKYKPYTKKQLLNLLLKVKKIVPPYLRINRLIRDIPEESIVAGNKITNLRQYLQKELARQGASCQCLRCREVRDEKYELKDLDLVRRDYLASQGQEIFLSFENKDRSKVYAFLRLRLNHDPQKNIFPELKNASIVRELHVYGQMVPVYQEALDDELGQTQHLGLGKRLMKEAEKITQENNLKKIAVISGIGVRNYYRKLGYKLEGTYLTKNLKNI
jgi:ELP3 family radical SAM enzyme/protein acetyltransferase